MAPAVHRCDVLEGKILRWLLFGEKELVTEQFSRPRPRPGGRSLEL